MATGRTLRIGLAGCGTVGAGVARLLAERHGDIARRTGVDLRLARVLVRDRDKERATGLPAEAVTTDRSALLAPEIDLVVEVVGGCDAARDIVLSAIQAGKHVVTANKALIALHGAEVFEAAEQAGVAVGVEASCCGGVPVMAAIERGLVANRVDALYGIVNGTCNYILTEMLEHRRTYADALAGAQRLGYAEAEPTLDVNGTDSAHKLAILASLVFDQPVEFEQVPVEGIEHLDLADLTAGYEQGYVCRLLAIARRDADGLTLLVSPAFLDVSNPLTHVRGPFNAVSLYGHAVGHTLYYGRGAGAGPTASAVLSDVVEIARGNLAPAACLASAYRVGAGGAEPLKPLDELRSRFYARFLVLDRPGAMSEITRAFAEHDVSLSAITQRDLHDETSQRVVTVVVITHRSHEGGFRRALERMSGLETVTQPPVAIRIVDEHQEF